MEKHLNKNSERYMAPECGVFGAGFEAVLCTSPDFNVPGRPGGSEDWWSNE